MDCRHAADQPVRALQEDDPHGPEIDVPIVVHHRTVNKFAQCAGVLDPRGAATHDDKGEQARHLRLVRLPGRPFKTADDVVFQGNALFEGLQEKGVVIDTPYTERMGDAPRGQNQVVVRKCLIVRFHDPVFDIDAPGMGQSKIDSRKFSKDAANGIGDVFRLQFGRGYLIEEGKKGVVVVPIDDEDITGCARLRAAQSPPNPAPTITRGFLLSSIYPLKNVPFYKK